MLYLTNKEKKTIERCKETQMSTIIKDNIIYIYIYIGMQQIKTKKIDKWMRWGSLFAHWRVVKKLEGWSIDWLRCWISNVVRKHKRERETERQREREREQN